MPKKGEAKNVLGEPLQLCCSSPKTGFYRDGFCNTGPHDVGRHIVCAKLTNDFLQYSKSRGNDLMTAIPQYGFPGLKEGILSLISFIFYFILFFRGFNLLTDLSTI